MLIKKTYIQDKLFPKKLKRYWFFNFFDYFVIKMWTFLDWVYNYQFLLNTQQDKGDGLSLH